MENTHRPTICAESAANTSIAKDLDLPDLLTELRQKRAEREQAQRNPGEFTVRDYQEQSCLSPQTAIRHVREFEKEGLVERVGTIKIGRNTSVLYRRVKQG